MTALSAVSISAQTARSKTDPVKVGDTAPDFSLADENGKTVTLSKLKQPTVLVFYRGYWCPFCARQLAELRMLKQKEEKFQILAISVDSAMRSWDLRSKIAKDGKGEIDFPLLSDTGGKTVEIYGVYDPTYAGTEVNGIPRASVFVLDKDRKVVWARIESDYKKRPTNEEIKLEIAKTK